MKKAVLFEKKIINSIKVDAIHDCIVSYIDYGLFKPFQDLFSYCGNGHRGVVLKIDLYGNNSIEISHRFLNKDRFRLTLCIRSEDVERFKSSIIHLGSSFRAINLMHDTNIIGRVDSFDKYRRIFIPSHDMRNLCSPCCSTRKRDKKEITDELHSCIYSYSELHYLINKDNILYGLDKLFK